MKKTITALLALCAALLPWMTAMGITFEQGKTYVISEDVQLTASTQLPADVTLIFQGGVLQSNTNVTLTGNNTRLVAPIGRIFGDKVTVKGSWDIDRAYPQWFGATTYSTFQDYSKVAKVADAGAAINKAITMKQRGEVFLIKGIYVIATPIIITVGIQLAGERGMEHYSGDAFNYSGAILQSWKSKNVTITDAADKYMVYVNADASKNSFTTGGFLAGQITAVKDVEFYNFIPSGNFTAKQLEISTTACQKVIYSDECCQFDHIRFYNFRQVIVYNKNRYIDNKQITNCDFVCHNKSFAKLPKLIAYNLSGLGDNLMFEHNALHQGAYSKGVLLDNCNSGTIRCNIINADVEINRSKAVNFSNNHMEYGVVISIKSSNVTTSNNYIERGYNTPIIITGNEYRDKSVVTMNTDTFVFIERPRDYHEQDEGTESKVNYNGMRNRMNNCSEYDIAMDNNAVLDLTNVFRYRLGQNADKMYPMGIKLCRAGDNAPVEQFNNHSYSLSQKGTVSSDYVVDGTFSVDTSQGINIYSAMKNGDTFWFAPSGNYTYQYQVMYDEPRRLLATRNGSQLFDVELSDNLKGGLTQNTHEGVLLVIAENESNACKGTIRLFRRHGNSMSYVDLPNNNNHYLYDNGITVNGYHWQNCNKSKILTGAKDVTSVTVQGKNVVCRLAGDQNASSWLKGDIIVNAGNGRENYKIVK